MHWSTPEVKQLNKERIRKAIQECGKCTKSQIAKMTALSVATCNNTLNEMLESNEIIKADQDDIIMGRPADRFIYNSDNHHVLGLALLGGDEHKVEYAISNALGEVISNERVSLDVIDYDSICKLIKEKTEEDQLINCISIGIPGVTHHNIIERCDIKTLNGVPLEDNIAKDFNMEVEVRNDMDYLACGLYYTTYQGHKNMTVIYIPSMEDSYVGASSVINDKILRGASKFSGELSYIAEAFGMTREEQAHSLDDRDKFVDYATKLTMSIISTIDPEEIILMGNEITDEEKDKIYDKCVEIVTKEHVPNLVVKEDFIQNYINGLIRYALNKTDFPLSELR